MTGFLSKRVFVSAFLISICIVLYIIIFSLADQRTKIVFCDVGQGDATYIRVNNRTDVLIDAGPDQSALNCLGKYMPFYDRTIEYTFLSHPQKDHMAGFYEILKRYKVHAFYTTETAINSQTFKLLKKTIISNKIPLYPVSNRDSLHIDTDEIKVLWPLANLSQLLIKDIMNDDSLIVLFEERDFSLLLSADAPAYIMNRLPEQSIKNLSILKVPHHGSKYGLNEKFLRLADPPVSVISVGKNNSYGHPAQKTLDLLKAAKTIIRRTDKEGNIVFKIPNYKFQIPSNIK